MARAKFRRVGDTEILRHIDCRNGCHCPHTTKSIAYHLGRSFSGMSVRLRQLEARGIILRVRRPQYSEWTLAPDEGSG